MFGEYFFVIFLCWILFLNVCLFFYVVLVAMIFLLGFMLALLAAFGLFSSNLENKRK